MADQTRGRKISDEVLDELLAGQDPAEAFRSGTLIDDLKKAVAERALDAEMEAHLEREGVRDASNHRNGHNRKRVLTDTGAMDLEVLRDRQGRFAPQLVEKYVRRLPGFDDKVISMYARGMATPVPAGQVGDPGPRPGAVRAVGVAGAGVEGDRRGSRRDPRVAVAAAGRRLRDRLLRRGGRQGPRRGRGAQQERQLAGACTSGSA